MHRFAFPLVSVLIASFLFIVISSPAFGAETAKTDGCSPALQFLDVLGFEPDSPNSVGGLSHVPGLAVGTSMNQPVYWLGTKLKRVPLPAGYDMGAVAAVNRFGLMVGSVSHDFVEPRAFRYWYGSSKIELYPKGAGAVAVNDAGHAVGTSPFLDGAAQVLYEYGPGPRVRRTLSKPAGFQGFNLSGINNAGTIIGSGTSILDGSIHGFTWSASSPIARPLQTQDHFSTIFPNDINNFNHIVGVGFDAGSGGDAVFWTSVTTPGRRAVTTGPWVRSQFNAISPQSNLSVGGGWTTLPNQGTQPAALIWPGSGPLRALPSLSAEPQQSAASAINEYGQVAGVTADSTGLVRPVIWNCALKQAYIPH